MNSLVGNTRQEPSATRSSTHASMSRPSTTPSSGHHGAHHDPGRHAGVVGEQRHDRGVLLVVADTWEWTRTDTGEQTRTTDTELTVRTPDRVCLQVSLIRGSEASPVANRCID